MIRKPSNEIEVMTEIAQGLREVATKFCIVSKDLKKNRVYIHVRHALENHATEIERWVSWMKLGQGIPKVSKKKSRKT